MRHPRPRRARLRSTVNTKKPFSKRQKLLLKVLFGLIFMLFLLGLSFWKFLPSKYWDGRTRLALAVETSEDVEILIFDPHTQSIGTVKVPKETQVNASKQRGVWRLGSIWKLAQQEDLGGKFLSDTLTKSLRVPIETWAQGKAINLSSKNPILSFFTAISNFDSNLTIKDRLGLAIFSSKVKNSDRFSLDLVQMGYLREKKLPDGEDGYTISSQIPSRLVALFSDVDLANSSARLSIEDKTTKRGMVEEIGEVLGNLGVKVYAFNDNEVENSDCTVLGDDLVVINKVSRLYDCQIEQTNTGSGEIKLILGEEFIKRY